VPQDVDVAVVGVDFEPALRGSVPAVDDGADFYASVTEPEGEWLLVRAVAGVAGDADGHVVTVPNRGVTRLAWDCEAPALAQALPGKSCYGLKASLALTEAPNAGCEPPTI